ncbi:MAG TPA: ABC transporter permease [Terracidiphilus sp.]|jgi:predicted permease|nr:ABC transporter permease [Terracidiphilus sp.]
MILQDIRYAVRQTRRAPGFALTVVLTLALGVGVATAVFCVIDAVILRPLPYAHPERIVDIQTQSRSGYGQPASWPAYQDERAQAHSFAALAGYINYFQVTMETPSNGPVLLDGVNSTGNFFQVFGVNPMLGRTFLPGEEVDGKNDIAVLSFDAWQKYFGGAKDVVGRTIKLDGTAYAVIGVMPAGFRFPLNERDAIYMPLYLEGRAWMKGRGNHWLRTVARLKDGASIRQGQADLAQVFSNMGKAYPQTDEGRTVKLQPLAQSVNEQTKGPLWTLLAAVLAVLLIGCVNVAGLLLARGVKREREMAMRTAIGAGRARLVRQVLTEGLMLAAAGAALGVLLASVLLDAMRTFLIHALARGGEIHLNWTVLGAALAAAVAVSLAASLYPALRMAGADPSRALKTGGGSAGTERGQHRLRAAFVITQVALTLVLLVVSGMLIRMVTRYRHTDLGFDPAHILTTPINLSPDNYRARDAIADFYQPLFSRVAQIPGVRAVGIINMLPIESYGSNSDIHIAGQPPYPPNQEMLAEGRFVSTGYFDVFGIPLRSGRMLSPSLDRPDNPSAAVVVNERFVRKFMPKGMDAVGQRIDDADKEADWTRIVGVVGNVRQDIYKPPLAERDWLIDELPVKLRPGPLTGMSLVMRVDGDPMAIVPALRSAIHDVDATVPFKEAYTMTDVVSRTLVFERMESWLFGVFAGLALVLAMIGLYGLLSHEVEMSTRDIGVRMALGASRPRILGMVLRRVTWMLLAGTAAGLLLTVLVRKTIDMVIYMDAEKESGTLLLTALLMLVVGMIAALIPARRAASIEPMQALRTE